MRAIIVCLALCLTGLGTAIAQSSRIDASGGGGFSVPEGRAGNNLNTGWNLDFRGGYRATEHLALDLDFNYNRWNLNAAALARFGEPGGFETIWSITVLPTYRLAAHWHATPYFMGGPGLYYRNLSLTQPTLVNTLVCDPFFGFCYPAIVGVNQVVASDTTFKMGINGGAGIQIPLGPSHLKAFGEARYSRMFTTNGPDLTFIPVTFGLRW